MKKIIKELHQGKHISENLSCYAKETWRTCEAYSGLELTFSAYTFVEEIQEHKDLAKQEQKAIKQILDGLGALSKCQEQEKLLSVMDKLRKEVTEKMDLFTSYADRLICYEYILNRMEYNYLSPKELDMRLERMDEESFMERVKRYIFGGNDGAAMQDKIRLVTGQMPVRMTSARFFERLKEALSLYEGCQKQTLEDFIYVIRTAGMLYEPKAVIETYPSFARDFETLKNADYTKLDREEYEELTGALERTAAQIREWTDFYYSMQKVINHLYAQCLTGRWDHEKLPVMDLCRDVWKFLAEGKCRQELLVPLEGKIERQIEQYQYAESVLQEWKETYEEQIKEGGMEELFYDLTMLSYLMSDSLFVKLEQEEEEPADGKMIEERLNQLTEEFQNAFKEVSRPVKRAMMGEVLEKLPMVYKNRDEVLDYIRTNLFGCQNAPERCVVYSLIDEMMRQEEEWC